MACIVPERNRRASSLGGSCDSTWLVDSRKLRAHRQLKNVSRGPSPVANSVIMIEWARNNEPTHSSRDEFIWHQLLLSLLYDEVLAQDETVIISKQKAKWFSTPSDFETLTKVAECGG